jgi:hypothetical protein
MLLQRLDKDDRLALQLLEPQDACRAKYLQFIKDHLVNADQPEQQNSGEHQEQVPQDSLWSRWKAKVKTALS